MQIRQNRCAVALLGLLLLASAGSLPVQPLQAHGTEARRVVSLSWPKDRISRVLAANRSELGLNGSKAPEQTLTVDGRACLFGDLFAFDVDDHYAFDIDEPVDVTRHLRARPHTAVPRCLGPERRRRIWRVGSDHARAGCRASSGDGPPDEGAARGAGHPEDGFRRRRAAAASSSATSRSTGAGRPPRPRRADGFASRSRTRRAARRCPRGWGSTTPAAARPCLQTTRWSCTATRTRRGWCRWRNGCCGRRHIASRSTRAALTKPTCPPAATSWWPPKGPSTASSRARST